MNRLSPDNLNTFSWAGPLLPNFSRVMPFCIGPKSKSSFLDALRARSSSLRDFSISKSSILRELSEYYWSLIVLSNMRAPDCFVLDLRRIASELNKRRRSASALGWPLAISAAQHHKLFSQMKYWSWDQKSRFFIKNTYYFSTSVEHYGYYVYVCMWVIGYDNEINFSCLTA